MAKVDIKVDVVAQLENHIVQSSLHFFRVPAYFPLLKTVKKYLKTIRWPSAERLQRVLD